MQMRQIQLLFSSYVTMIICVWESWADASILKGAHSGELSSGHLVMPMRVHENGTFLSYNLTHHHAENYYIDEHRRRRRQLTTADNDNLPVKGVIHYRLNIPDETETLLHLELEPNNYFMTPHLIVERHRRDLRSRRKPTRNNTKCHFHGKIRGHAESKVAISTCAGLVGHIKTKNNEYFIEPSKEHNLIANEGHPHVVFHRHSVKQKKYNKIKRKKHKKQKNKKPKKNGLHRKHPHGKLSMFSNCGTKEPRRRMETRLEWQSLGKVKIQGGRHIRGHRNHIENYLNGDEFEQQQQHQPQTKLRYETAASKTASATVATLNRVRRHQTHHDISNNFNSTTITTRSAVPPVEYFIAASGNTGDDVDGDVDNGNSNSKYNQHRKKRSISSPRHVETLIVADATMVAFHEEVETYLLTIMNMVSSLYKDPSIGNSIEIVVVKIILLEEEETHMDLNLTQNAQQNLNMFCSWQHKLNSANENDPHHHDVAILVTRKNICGNNCMTLGLANVGGMCKPKQSCSVNEDNGIMLSHTVAHELGHNFGMFHDTAKIGCHPRVGSIVHIMTPTFGADTLQVCWSNCSRKYITHFLDQGLGDCLDDAPTPLNQYDYPVYQPGVIFNAELQCRLQFNVTDGDVGPCSAPNEICSTLWCRVNGECVTNMRPTAPGTSCGRNRWCQNGACVRMRNITVVDGGWGPWSPWSKCSRSCGGGISIQKRECNKPVPANGGLFCIGERKRYHICSTEACEVDEPSFRAQQCAKFNNVPYQGHIYKWLPYFDKKSPCKLFCTDEDDTVIANWGDVVEDGTPCKLGTNNMCIDGICRNIGCDWILDSELEDDRCGVCGGNGVQCKTVKEIFDKPFNTTDNYVEIVTIPSRARHIVIRELGNMPHFLSIAKAAPSDASTNGFYLNGDNLISMPGEFIIAGAESLYERNDEQEVISIPQPIEHAITLYVIVRGSEPNEGIFYEFTLPALNESSYAVGANYSWQFSDWTSCTVTCGGGLQYREVLCYNNNTVSSDDVPCWLRSWEQRPLRQSRSCNEQKCPAHWWTGPWSYCPVSCKDTNADSAVRQRSVMCLDHHEVVVDDAKCLAETRPPDKESCTEYLSDCSEIDKNYNSNSIFLQVQDL